MYVIGDLADKKLASKILETISKKGISAGKELSSAGRIIIYVNNEVDAPIALDIFRVALGFPPIHETSEESKKIQRLKPGLFTKGIILVCVGIYFLMMTGVQKEIILLLSYSKFLNKDFAEIINGQVWRLWTPALLHFGFMHIIFNMLWTWNLGAIFDKSFSIKTYVLFLLVVGIFSNTMQYYFGTSNFGGMSGIIFGQLGLIWTVKRINPEFPYTLPKSDWVILLGYFIICHIPGIFRFGIANLAHSGGLASGMIFGVGLEFLRGSKNTKWLMGGIGLSLLIFSFSLGIELLKNQ